jgi:transcriptional regulator with XRE-family HTH domain
MPDIGETLRDARMRARIDVSEIEAKTKIRAKYLRALENEEWSLLPGPTFVKSFLRTYAQALGLDGKALVEQYRASHERPSDAVLEPIVPASQRNRTRASGSRPPARPSRGYLGLVAVIVLIIGLLVYGIASGGSGSSTAKHKALTKHPARTTHKAAAPATRSAAATLPAAYVYLSLEPTARVSVCVLGDGGSKVIPETELLPGERTRTYRAHRFQVKLGNNAVVMRIDGVVRSVPPSSEPIAYSITKAYGRRVVPASRFPPCT